MDLYKVLGVDRNADERAIKKAYFDLAKRHHPDKGGDAEEFKKLICAICDQISYIEIADKLVSNIIETESVIVPIKRA